jgi:hypothetical protein
MFKRFVLALLLTGILAIGVASAAVAAPSEVSATFGPKAQYVTASSILLPVTVTCPASFGVAFVQATVSQSDTGGFGFGFAEITCTGGPVTVVLVITGGPFTLGSAIANGYAATGGQFDNDIRRIQIAL